MDTYDRGHEVETATRVSVGGTVEQVAISSGTKVQIGDLLVVLK